MDITGTIVLVGFLLFFAGMLYFAITTTRKEAEQ
jgi:cbb3-type cytochrome oxidase subunit 3